MRKSTQLEMLDHQAHLDELDFQVSEKIDSEQNEFSTPRKRRRLSTRGDDNNSASKEQEDFYSNHQILARKIQILDSEIHRDLLTEIPNSTQDSHLQSPNQPAEESQADLLKQKQATPFRPHSPSSFNFEAELANLPPHAFSSADSTDAPAPTNLRQTTLFGGITQPQIQTSKKRNWPLAEKQEVPTHHQLNREALATWIYPTNLGGIRDYQYSIVSSGLFHNLLVALPTGLGKTFIAASIMLNWYRWTKDAQIVFVAPTKPLVSQQVEACFQIVGIPRSSTTMLTGGVPPGLRAQEWISKRVFFMTPQTLINDLKTGISDPKRIVLLVVDEAHRATGGYSYVEVVKFLRRFNTSFRVLALTATPGSKVETVQEVIDGLGISRVEIRTEESIDIRQYVHARKIDTVLFSNSEEMSMIMDLFSAALQPTINKLNSMNAYWGKDPMTLTPFGLTTARQKWMGSDAGKKAGHAVRNMINVLFTILASLAHAIELLKYHGIGPFYRKLVEFRSNADQGASKKKQEIVNHSDFGKLMSRVQGWMNSPDFVGHPKLEHVRRVVLNHFLDAGDGRDADISPAATRIMIFAHYRDSAEEIARVLKRDDPMIRPHVFVGQANSKGSEGMDQKKQLEIIEQFKSGIYNTLVATSIGEEGLDIGQVDLIICYDASASPIRMLQRMGRTGRKRAGAIVLLLMRGKEENNFAQAKDNYEKMQQMIAAGDRFTFHDDLSPRIVPKSIQPVVDKRLIDIPIENSQVDLPEPRTKKVPKRPAKKFHMPDGVRKGFTTASRLDESESEARPRVKSLPRAVQIPSLQEVLLTPEEEMELEDKYLDVGGNAPQIVQGPRFDTYPRTQRTLRQWQLIPHGNATKRIVSMLKSIHEQQEYSSLDFNLDSRDRDLVDAQFQRRKAHGNMKEEDVAETKAARSHSIDSDLGGFRSRDLTISLSSPEPTSISKPFYQPSVFKADDWDDDFEEMDNLLDTMTSVSTKQSVKLHGSEKSRNKKRYLVESDEDSQ